jgi:DNA invertase Pin-like site-specific DNA recombinase
MILGSWVAGRPARQAVEFLLRRLDFCVERLCNAVMKTKRVAIYVRVSTTEQDTEGQETELREYVDRRGWNYEVYRDQGQSGAKSDRPELTRLLADLRRRKLDIVVVWALDRLARSLRQLLEIAEQCQSLGVDLVSLRQNIDTTLPAGRLTFQILGAVAEFEREMLRERVKAGMAQARRTGKRMGRPALRCFNPSDVERLRALRSQGTSVRRLAKDFGTSQWMVAKLTEPSAVATS